MPSPLDPKALRKLQGIGSGQEAEADAGAAPPEAAAAAKDPRNRIAEYVLVVRLGGGGAGDVWKAWDTRLGRWVAIKFPRVGTQSAVQRRRFLQEAQAAARLSHPHIVPVYRADETDGRPYLVMAYLEGASPEAGKLPPKQAATAVRHAAEALAYAHAQGVVHRDIKPGNLILDEHGAAWVVDFGLAFLEESGRGLTAEGAVLGTPAYMSPEQARGSAEARKPATDIYSLGATLYELCTGRPPYNGRTFAEIVRRVLDTDIVPPRQVEARIPSDLETIILKAMDREPSRRYASAAELADDLGRFLEGEAIAARPSSAMRRFWRRLIKNRGVLVPAAVAGTLLLAGLVALAAGSVQRASRLSSALQGAAAAEAAGDLERAFHLWQTALEIDPSRADAQAGRRRVEEGLTRRREEARRMEAERQARELIAAARPAIDRADGIFYEASADFPGLRKKVAEARPPLEKAASIAPHLAEAHDVLGRAWWLLGYEEQAERCFVRALEADPAFGPAHLDLARLLVERAVLENLFASGDEAMERFRRANDTGRRAAAHLTQALKSPGLLIGEVQDRLVRVLVAYFEGERDRAILDVREAAEQYGGRQGSEDLLCLAALTMKRSQADALLDRALQVRPHFPLALIVRGTFRRRAGELDAALEDYRRVLQIQPRNVWGLEGRAAILAKRGRTAEAIADIRTAAEIRPDFDATYAHDIAGLLARSGDLPGARREIEAALARHPGSADCHAQHGTILRDSGDSSGAERAFSKAIDLNPEDGRTFRMRGNLRAGQGRTEEAVADWRRAVGLNPRDATSWFNLALGLYRLGKFDEALGAAERAVELIPDGREREEARKLVEEIRGKQRGR